MKTYLIPIRSFQVFFSQKVMKDIKHKNLRYPTVIQLEKKTKPPGLVCKYLFCLCLKLVDSFTVDGSMGTGTQ